MSLKKVCLFSDHQVSYNPRLWKEAFFWEKRGYEVVIVTMWISEKALIRDREILSGHNIRYENYLSFIPGQISKSSLLFFRVRKRLFGEMHKWLKIGFQWAISYAPEKMYRAVLAEDADIYSAHMECAFYAGRKLINQGKKVIFDFEDWYSRDYLVPERPVRLLTEIEKFALHNGSFCMAASDAMATALFQVYKPERKPAVVYNGFSRGENVMPTSRKKTGGEKIKLIWFSRTVGPYRGLERMVESLKYLTIPAELHLLGETPADYKNEMEKIFSGMKDHSLHFHDFIPHHQITSFLSGFDIGLAIEQTINDNRRLTITNKILQYLQAGLKILATNTPGQEEVRNYFPSMVKLVDADGDGREWALKVEELAMSAKDDYSVHIEKFNEIFSMEAQENKLDKLVAEFF